MLERAAASGQGGWGPGRPPLRTVDKMLRNLWLVRVLKFVCSCARVCERVCAYVCLCVCGG